MVKTIKVIYLLFFVLVNDGVISCIKTFDEWMRKNPNFCTNPPDDLHQTYECHRAQGKLFIDQIKNFGEKVKSSCLY